MRNKFLLFIEDVFIWLFDLLPSQINSIKLFVYLFICVFGLIRSTDPQINK